MTNKSIGKVKLSYLKKLTKTPEYSDGDVEDEILDLYKKGLSDEQRRKILSDNPSWPIRYHLAYERGNLVNWYEFKKGSRVLEVGGGCGAITEALVANKDITVVSNELSERRATINAYRNKSASNLEIVVGNLQDYKPKEKFDYIVCVGVLEYSGTFINSDNPYEEFIRLLKGFLKPNGVILVAIENKLGFKYLSGAREDHTGGYFDGINNYPKKEPRVRTFGREELTALFEQAGIAINNYYFPFPDYKLPKIIYSDKYLPGQDGVAVPKGVLPSPNFDQSREHLFSEQLFVDSLEKNRLFSSMANSFMVEAYLNDASKIKNSTIFSITNNNRLPKFQVKTSAYQKDGSIVFRKEATNPLAIKHVNQLVDTEKLLTNHIKKAKNIDLLGVAPIIHHDAKNGVIEFAQIKGRGADQLLLDAVLNNDLLRAKNILDRFISILEALSIKNDKYTTNTKVTNVFGNVLTKNFKADTIMVGGLIDYNFDNFIVEDGTNKWWLIDYEWAFKEAIPTEYILNRTLMYFGWMHKQMIGSNSDKQEMLISNYWTIPKELVFASEIKQSMLLKSFDIEFEKLQPHVNGTNTQFIKPITIRGNRAERWDDTYYIQRIEKQIQGMQQLIHSQEQIINEQNATIRQVKDKNTNLQADIQTLLNSKTYKLGRIISKPYRSANSIIDRIKNEK